MRAMLVAAIGMLAFLCMSCTKETHEEISLKPVPNYPAPRKPIINQNPFFSELHLPPGLGQNEQAATINPEVAKQGPQLEEKLKAPIAGDKKAKKVAGVKKAKTQKAAGKVKKRKKR